MKIKAQVTEVGQFTQQNYHDASKGTFLALPVKFKVAEYKRYVVVDQETGTTEQQTFSDIVYSRFTGKRAQDVANMNLQPGEGVEIEMHFSIDLQYNRCETYITSVTRPAPQAPQFGV